MHNQHNRKTILYALSLLFFIASITACARNKVATDTIHTQSPVLSVEEYIEKDFTSNVPLKVHFIDVGQGDSEFIELPNKKTILIDAGIPDESNTVSRLISSLGYSKIDYVVATHPHNDHIGGMPAILNKYTIGNFYMPDKEHTTKAFMSMLSALENNGCKAEYAKSGKVFIDESGIKATFLAPASSSYSDLNNYSAVVKLTYNNSSFLFMGDAEEISENEMLLSEANLNADVLKVAHHGSSYSCTAAFLSKVSPKYAIISVGNNSYGHPANDTLQRLKSFGISIYRTDLLRTITVETDGNSYTIDKNENTIQSNAPPDQ